MTLQSPEASAPSESFIAPIAQNITVPPKTAEIIRLPAKVDAKSIVVPGGIKGGKGGEGGTDTPSSTAFTPSNREFLKTIFCELPEGARPVVTGKSGDPGPGGWSPADAKEVEEICSPQRNAYFNCASLNPVDNTLAARLDRAAAYHVLVLDDVGTKVDRELLGDVTPTWELETSPGNYQIGFRLSPPLQSPVEVERFQRRFADAGLTDTGALGMVRWVRLPNGINGKPKYRVNGEPFQCRLESWNATVCYSAQDLVAALVPVSFASPTVAIPAIDRKVAKPIGNGVYFPATDENPVITAFKDRGLYKRPISQGRHDVTCPWAHEHTDVLDTGAAYFEPSESYPTGGFRCHHSHGEDLQIGKVLEQFGLSSGDARNRPRIRIVNGELTAIVASAEEALAKRGGLYQSGGFIVSAKVDPMTGDWTIKPLSEAELTLALSAACDWEKYDGRSKEWSRCDPLERTVKMVYRAEDYRHLPHLRGFARQPYYRAGGTELVSNSGYDPITQRLATFDAQEFTLPPATRESAKKSLTLLKGLLSEFHFAQEVDRAATLAAIMTAVVRPALELAPAFHVTAPSPGSGKSYLCETIALFAGPGPSAKISYPRTSEEATKVILSTLLAGPAVIEFDDMDTDWIPHGAINRMLTATSITDRVLGYSRMATVGTNALVLGSGNNVMPIRDLVRRVLTINLNAKSESPATLSYKGNPVAAVKTNRAGYVAAALKIVEAWNAAGKPKAAVSSIASYGGDWSDLCRQPLIWLGEPDPATTLLEQVKTDPDADVLRSMLEEWYRQFGDKPVPVRRLLQDAYDTDLHDCLMELPVTDRGVINRSKLGWFLKKANGRIVGGYTVQRIDGSERREWKVVKAGPAPALPASPPSGQNDDIALAPEDQF